MPRGNVADLKFMAWKKNKAHELLEMKQNETQRFKPAFVLYEAIKIVLIGPGTVLGVPPPKNITEKRAADQGG